MGVILLFLVSSQRLFERKLGNNVFHLLEPQSMRRYLSKDRDPRTNAPTNPGLWSLFEDIERTHKGELVIAHTHSTHTNANTCVRIINRKEGVEKKIKKDKRRIIEKNQYMRAGKSLCRSSMANAPEPLLYPVVLVVARYEPISSELRDLLNRVLTLEPDIRISIDQVLEHPWLAAHPPTDQVKEGSNSSNNQKKKKKK
jgi:serine/threonine protein kinase